MVQMMPGANEHLITMIEDTIAHAPHLTTVINAETKPEQLIELALGEIDFEILDEKDVSFQCTCSFERATAMVSALGRDEVESMLREQGGATMNCGFCNEVYALSAEDLEAIISRA